MTRPRGVSASPPPALFPARRRLPPRSGKRSEAGPALSPGRAAESRRPPPGREEGRNGAWRSVGKFVPRCTPYPPERSVPRWLRKRSSRGVHLLRGGGGGGTEEGEVAAAAPRGRGERSSAPPPTPSPRAPLASCAGGAD